MVSNAGMDTQDTLDNRITELEIKSSYQEDLIDKLDQVIIRQQQQIDQLVEALVKLREQRPESAPGASNLRDELPPHY